MTWTLTSSPTRRAAAAPASVAALTAELLALQDHVGGLHHGIGGLDCGDQTFRFNQAKGIHHISSNSSEITTLAQIRRALRLFPAEYTFIVCGSAV
jgi:hypothetical protein